MVSPKKRNVRVQKFHTKYKFKGRRRKSTPKTISEKSVPKPPRPNDGSGSDEIDSAVHFVSASEKKIGLFKNEERRCDSSSSAVICDIDALTVLTKGAVCPVCRECQLCVRESPRKCKGLSSYLELCCGNSECPESVLSSSYTSRHAAASGNVSADVAASADTSAQRSYLSGSSRDSFAVNVKAVVAARAIGAGYDQLMRLCTIIGLPKPMHQMSFHAIAKKVHSAAVNAAAKNLDKAREIEAQIGGADAAVMYDGTWQKRGHKSHNGVGTVVALDSGLCLDFEVLSNFCLACSLHKVLSSEEEEIWQAFHSPVCEKNVECSSHGMEEEAALRIWQRTLSYGTPLRFTKFLSDGDSKAYTAVSEAQVYGATTIEKEDCTNHVAKRLGTALRQLKTPLPRGEKLKEPTIQKLQTYYQIAITHNRGDLRAMYCSIWALYLHSCSSAGASGHKFCPEGPSSWCKHKRAEALGQPPPAHTPLLTKAQGKALLPIYKRLTEDKLLARCIQGKTQNAAESLNSKIWLLCPKTRFASRTAVETATALAALWFNRGHRSFEQVLEELGVVPPKELLVLSECKDNVRIQKMSERQTAEARAHRRSVAKKARVEDCTRKAHEGVTYGAGEF
ncbi:uncharacterized protein LOC144107678 [Amblyomma americanum]